MTKKKAALYDQNPKNLRKNLSTLGGLYDQAASPPPFFEKPLIFQVAITPLIRYVGVVVKKLHTYQPQKKTQPQKTKNPKNSIKKSYPIAWFLKIPKPLKKGPP